ncbi:hypothetical protein N172_03625 [Pantoea dispersa EGD-AAK13]|nr:hypothetical protein N172_03625 [Pantoea dispersa EGD-AAK13]
MPSAFSLLEKDRHDAVAVTHPAACVVIQSYATLANLFGGDAVLLRPVAEFLIAAFTIDKIDIYGAFISENGGESDIAALAISFTHEQHQAATGVMRDTICVAHINRQHVGHKALPSRIDFALKFEFFFGTLVFMFYPKFGVVAGLGIVASFDAKSGEFIYVRG